ncbi:MAG: PQQ-dependent sugar dehydrogenase [Tepidisphaeraceae bacterium]
MKRPLAAFIAIGLATSSVFGQAMLATTQPTDVTITGHVYEPLKLKATDENIAQLKAPAGFAVTKFAEGLVNPRMMAVADDGVVYVTRRDLGDCVMLKDTDGDGKADVQQVVASRPNLHGIAVHGDDVYFVTVHDLYLAKRNRDGTLGGLERLIDNLPDAGQHPNRTVVWGPDDMLYLSIGSTANATLEPNPENATMLRVSPDGKSRSIFASGLRNTIGFGFHPATHVLWGMDHGIDWLGDDAQPEELNKIERGKAYGWPYIYGKGGFNPQDDPPGEMTLEQWRAMSTEPVLTYTAHSADATGVCRQNPLPGRVQERRVRRDARQLEPQAAERIRGRAHPLRRQGRAAIDRAVRHRLAHQAARRQLRPVRATRGLRGREGRLTAGERRPEWRDLPNQLLRAGGASKTSRHQVNNHKSFFCVSWCLCGSAIEDQHANPNRSDHAHVAGRRGV